MYKEGKKMKKIKFLLIILLLPLLLTSCFRKKAYTVPIHDGTYLSEESFLLHQKEYSMKLIVKEITKDDFSLAKNENVLQDFSLSLQERKYYSFEFYLLNDLNEIPLSMSFVKKCNPHAVGPNLFYIEITFPIEEQQVSYEAKLRNESNDYFLSIDDLKEEMNIHLHSYI